MKHKSSSPIVVKVNPSETHSDLYQCILKIKYYSIEITHCRQQGGLNTAQ